MLPFGALDFVRVRARRMPAMRRTCGILLVMFAAPSFAADAQLGEPKDLTFTATVDGSTQRYVEMLPEKFDRDEVHHVLIALHGHGSDRWQAVNSAYKEFEAAREVAAKFDMIYVSPDYRATTSWMGPKAEADLVQII